MGHVLLTKRIEFAAAHRYHNDLWDAARNRAVFGPCNHEPGHGHNYLLEVTVAGEVDQQTGMVVNLYDLKQVLKAVLEEFDHKHLNLDTPYFSDRIPTTENIAAVLWQVLAGRTEIGRLEVVRVCEDEDLCAEVTAEAGTGAARVTRRYSFASAHRLHAAHLTAAENERIYGACHRPSGHNYDLFVTVSGPVDRESGMVVDLKALDRMVAREVVDRFDHRDVTADPAFAGGVATGENFVRLIWGLLATSIPGGRLHRVRLVESRDLSFEYAGACAAEAPRQAGVIR